MSIHAVTDTMIERNVKLFVVACCLAPVLPAQAQQDWIGQSCGATPAPFAAPEITGRTYRVSPSCSDGNLCSLAQVNDLALQPGDAVLFQAGGIWRVSDASARLQTRSGVVYGRYGSGPNPALDGAETPLGWEGLIDIRNVNNVLVDGIDIRNSTQFAILVSDASKVTLRNVRVDETDGGGIVAISSKDVNIHDSEVTNASGGPHEAIALVDVDGFYISKVRSRNNGHAAINIKSNSRNGVVHSSEFTATSDDPTFYIERAENLKIYNNYIHTNSGSSTMKPLVAIGIEPFDDYETRYNRNIEFFNNIVANAGRIGIDMWIKDIAYQGTWDYNSQVLLQANLSFGNRSGGEQLMHNIHIHNNTIVSTGQMGESWSAAIRTSDDRPNRDASDWSDIVIEDNILWDTGAADAILLRHGIRATVRNNLFESGETGETGTAALLASDPGFVDLQTGNFALKPESPARGAGVNGGDIGASFTSCGDTAASPTPPSLSVIDG